ncbi:hypothetical protein GCM10027081_09830 [Cupriavidus yeoncheonensis]
MRRGAGVPQWVGKVWHGSLLLSDIGWPCIGERAALCVMVVAGAVPYKRYFGRDRLRKSQATDRKAGPAGAADPAPEGCQNDLRTLA